MTPITQGALRSLTIIAAFVAVGLVYAAWLPAWTVPAGLALFGFGVLVRAWWRSRPLGAERDLACVLGGGTRRHGAAARPDLDREVPGERPASGGLAGRPSPDWEVGGGTSSRAGGAS